MSERCRACSGALFPEPLIHHRDMPRVAQYLPDRDTVKADTGIDLLVCQCSCCGLVQLVGEPVPYYRQVIRSSGFSAEMKNYRRQQFQQYVSDHGLKDKKIVEIGCGNGEYLSILQEFCRQSYGLEYAEDAVQKCTAAGLRVVRGFVDTESYRMPEAPFDAFLILNFLEHFPEPGVALRGIANNLTEDAVGLIEVPNFDMILDTKMFADFSTEHLSYFTQGTLVSTLGVNGYDVIDSAVSWYGHILSAVVRKKKKVQMGDFIQHQERLKEVVEKYLSRFGQKKVAVWGAGHQSLATIALLRLGDKITYVVDSAVFKHGKYTPVTHVPIVSPEKLISEPVDAVIIIASSYADEVAETLRKKYPTVSHVAILRDNRLEVIK